MLSLLLEVAGHRLAIAARDVVEVIPAIPLQRPPHCPLQVAGFCVYRGHVVPVVDLCQILSGKPSGSNLSSRILIVQVSVELTDSSTDRVTAPENFAENAANTATSMAVHGPSTQTRSQRLGIQCERVTQLEEVRWQPELFAGLSAAAGVQLGGVQAAGEQLVQRVDVAHLLHQATWQAVFGGRVQGSTVSGPAAVRPTTAGGFASAEFVQSATPGSSQGACP